MELEKNAPLREYTTIKVGGKALYLARPASLGELRLTLKLAREENLPLCVLGRGANTIFGDVEGVVLHTGLLRGVEVRESEKEVEVKALCGTPLKEIHRIALKAGAEGFYRLYGFPASVGGAVAMNAGAFGVEISDFLKEVCFLSWEGELVSLKREELDFSYRSSPFPEIGIVFWAVFRLRKTERDVKKELERIRRERIRKQPLNLPTSGSTFKNPPGHFAGKLLEEAGLKGFRLGRVGFSEKHANFLVNYGGAEPQEVKELIGLAKERVRTLTGFLLEEEVRFLEARRSDGWKVL